MNNPYFGQNFLGFFEQLLFRVVRGEIWENMVLDELQILVLSAVAVSSALVGCFLVLRRMTMLANSLSHTILLGIVVTYILTSGHSHSGINVEQMLLAALITGLLTTFLTEFLSKVMGLQEDASTGLVFTSMFALGIALLTAYSRNAHIGSEAVMGNADALHEGDLKLVLWILGLNILIFTLSFKEFKITTFDPGLSRAMGVSTVFFNYLLMAQVSATAIGAFRAVGVLMVLALITGPALTARLLTHQLWRMLLLASALGVSASILGVALSRHIFSVQHIALSTSGLVVCIIVFQYLAAVIIAPEQGLIARAVHRRRHRSEITSA